MSDYPTRPVVMARRGVVTSGHYLASEAGLRMLQSGGNAVDAAAAAGFCLNLLEPHQNGLGGEVPTLVYSARDRRAFAISGMGWSPAAFTIDWCRQNSIDLIPGDGFLPACVPAVVGTWIEALARFGRLSLSQVLQPAIELAEDGFPVYADLRNMLTANQARFERHYPSTAAVFYPEGRPPEIGELLRNPDWARTLRTLCRAEEEHRHSGRVRALEAARDAFYAGPIAERIVEFISSHPVNDSSGTAHQGLFTVADFAEWRARVEDPVSVSYRGLDVHKCASWCQGPVFLQQLTLLEGFDLKSMGHNSPEYLHTVVECAKLAFADREAYYGDPLHDRVPFDTLLSKEYAATRRGLIGSSASLDFRPGDAGGGIPEYASFDVASDNRRAIEQFARPSSGDTTQLDVIDAEGNMVSATPSGGWIGTSPVVPGLGFALGTRGQMFYLDPRRPNALAPHKRPRATLTPSLVTRDGEPYMVFGTPGGDNQDQWTLQFFLNHVDFGMDLQQALDAPTLASDHVPSSFYPRQAHPGQITAEDRIPAGSLEELRRRGHRVVVASGWSNGKPMAIALDRTRRSIRGAVSARGVIGYALGW